MRRLGTTLALLLALAPAAQAADQPQVAIAADGDASFVWRINDSRNDQVQARQAFTSGFSTFLTDTQYLSAPGRKAFEPQVAVDGAGNAVFVWTRFNGFLNVIQTRTMRTDGSLTPVQTLSVVVSPLTTGNDSPQVAVDPTTGNAVFVWKYSSFGTGSGQSYVHARTRAADGTLGQTHFLSAGSPSPNGGPFVYEPQVGVDLNGTAVFTWTHRDGDGSFGSDTIETRRLNADGTLSPLQTVSDEAHDAKDPQVAVDGNGPAALVWLGYDEADWIVQRRTLSPTGALGAIGILSAVGSESRDPQVAVAPNFNTAYVWSRQVLSGKYTVQTRTSGPAGLTATQSLSLGGEDALTPQVGIDNNNNAVYTWSRSNGTNRIVQFRSRSASGTLGPIQNLSATGANGLDPQIARTGSGDTAFVWRRSSRSGSIIQGTTRVGGVATLPKDLSR